MSPLRAYLTRPVLTSQSVSSAVARRSHFLRLAFLQLAFLEFALLKRLTGVLGGGDLSCGEIDSERRGADDHRDTGDPQQRVGVAGVERVELGGRHIGDRSRGAAQIQRARRDD